MSSDTCSDLVIAHFTSALWRESITWSNQTVVQSISAQHATERSGSASSSIMLKDTRPSLRCASNSVECSSSRTSTKKMKCRLTIGSNFVTLTSKRRLQRMTIRGSFKANSTYQQLHRGVERAQHKSKQNSWGEVRDNLRKIDLQVPSNLEPNIKVGNDLSLILLINKININRLINNNFNVDKYYNRNYF